TAGASINLRPRQIEVKRGAIAERGFHPYASSMEAHDLPANGQAHPVSGGLVARLEALENTEDLLRILRVDSDSVVLCGKHPFAAAAIDGDMDAGDVRAPKLDRVYQQILEQPRQLDQISHHRGQR